MSRKEEIKNIRKIFSKLNKVNRCQTFAKSKSIPNSYKENTLKEELVLEHLIQYRKEFANALDPKRELFLYPMNETGKYKFICTTIRPTKVPYPELYEYDKCAKFLADFIEYEELNPPNEFPRYLPSPENTIIWQIGDCFDISIVLCSLLIGSGYNAYVVYGKAPRFITTKDESDLPPPEIPDDIKVIENNLKELTNEQKPEITKYKEKIVSKYDQEEENERKEKEDQEWIKENVINDDEPELKRYDPWNQKRLHCWVLIKKNKRLDKTLYIEPATGRLYSVEEPPFESIDAVFNNINFWINLQHEKPIKEIDLNLNNKAFWEYVMLNAREVSDDNEEYDNYQDKTMDTTEQGIVDMPPPWPNKLYISQWAYHSRVPLATQTFYFQKTKIDKFSTYSQIDGKVLVIYKYSDFGRLRLIEVETRYRSRKDKLYKRFSYPYEHKVISLYLPGQEYGWKSIEEVEGSYKTINYYETNYDTGLIYREEIFGKKIIHKYKSRDDRVFERKVEVEDKSEETSSKQYFMDSPFYLNKLLIKKFTQKYHTNPLDPVSKNCF
jgi:hypothetical protein